MKTNNDPVRRKTFKKSWRVYEAV